jgi:ABC-2 type transport system ATP-binding protein
MLVFDYLNYVADIREIQPDRKFARIRELGDLCGLNPVMHMPIAELSKGFRQRVGLAHAMMSDPEILVLDEPTSGLDPNQIVEIRDIIKRIGKQKTVVLSTHILSEAEATCDRVVIISRGKIVADGDIDKLKQSAGGTSLIHLTLQQADSDAVRQKLSATTGVQGVVRLEAVNSQLKVTLSVPSVGDLRGEIYRTVKQTDWELLEFYQESRTLETVFRELTKEN